MEMDVLPSNHQVLAMIKGHWPAARTGPSGDYDTICVQLPHSQRGPQVQPARPGRRQSTLTAPALRATGFSRGYPGGRLRCTIRSMVLVKVRRQQGVEQ
jgi:hypothetical protein